MKVLDLFAGLKGWSAAFESRGHDIRTLDIEPKFSCTYTTDILEWNPEALGGWSPDIILASPPCQGFSVMNIGRNWTGPNDDPPHAPKSDKARLALALVERALDIIDYCKPKFFIIENPRAKLRKLPVVDGLERRTVTWCQYGDRRMKPTDLWGGFPPSLALRPPCSNGSPCHVAAPRGSQTGTQRMDPDEAAKIPYELSLVVCLSVEKYLERV